MEVPGIIDSLILITQFNPTFTTSLDLECNSNIIALIRTNHRLTLR